MAQSLIIDGIITKPYFLHFMLRCTARFSVLASFYYLLTLWCMTMHPELEITLFRHENNYENICPWDSPVLNGICFKRQMNLIRSLTGIFHSNLMHCFTCFERGFSKAVKDVRVKKICAHLYWLDHNHFCSLNTDKSDRLIHLFCKWQNYPSQRITLIHEIERDGVVERNI